MLLLALIWGVNYSVVKQTLQEILPLAFNALRFSLASILLLFVLQMSDGGLLLERRDFNRVFMLGILGYALHQILFIVGIAQTTASPDDSDKPGLRGSSEPVY